MKTIRFRLMFGLFAIVLIANALLSFVTVQHVVGALMSEVRNRVRLDLNSARQVYENRIEDIAHLLKGVSVVAEKDNIKGHLKELREVGGLDILALVDSDGKVLFRAENDMAGDSMTWNPIVSQALEKGKMVSGTIIVPDSELAKEDPRLAQRAYMTIEPTKAARPLNQQFETDGMVIAAAVPFSYVDGERKVSAFLYGARLQNRQYGIVDTIKEEVFQGQEFKGKDIGTATIFQGDLRISTNVKKNDGTRAIGTRVSEVVYNKVVVQGEVWSDEAFVVNDWYIAAYEPIRDPTGSIIGMLYVGLLQAPFLQTKHFIISVFLIIVAVTTVMSLVLFFLVIRHMLSPISRIVDMSRRVIGGDLSARVRIRPPGEMGLLCQKIDRMAEAVYEREEQLQRAAREQISQSDKLASIGRLAAGIAHEINNPLTAVLTFSHLLHDDETVTENQKKDLELIIRETTRVREIVRGLLDFARESPRENQVLDLNEALRRTLKLVRSQKEFVPVSIIENFSEDLVDVCGDKNQIQQVFLNLTINACEAMPDGGTLTVRTRNVGDHVEVQFIDTGTGISPDMQDKIFDPFFTTKPVGKGTGLGLSVSYGIIQHHGGELTMESEPGKGTTFIVLLPCCDEKDFLIEDDER